MGRKSGNTPWHAAALRLHATGLSAAKIVEALAQTPTPAGIDAVKKLLARSKQDPGRALQAVATSGLSEPPPRPPLSPDDAKKIDALFMVLENHRAETIKLAMRTARVFLKTSPESITKEHFAKLNGALEVLKVLKAGVDGPRPDTPEGEDKDKGGNPRKFDPEDQRRRARERLDQLATTNS